MRARGFTLVEVLVALTISGVVVLLAHQLFSGVADGSRSLVAARLQLDRSANARRWLAAALLSLDVGQDSAGPFEGRADRVRFATWLQTENGWFERRQVVLQRDGGNMTAQLASTEQGAARDSSDLRLADSISDVAFDYLLEPGAETRWVREWISPVSAPLAIRIRVTRERGNGDPKIVVDTLLFLIKERG